MLHLKTKEGCTVSDPTKTSDSLKATVQDSLGYRYEVQIKCLGRTYLQQFEGESYGRWTSEKNIQTVPRQTKKPN